MSLSNIPDLKEIDYTPQKYFDVSSSIILFHIQKNYIGDIKITGEDGTIHYTQKNESVIQLKDVIPDNLFNKIKLQGAKQSDKLFIGDVSFH